MSFTFLLLRQRRNPSRSTGLMSYIKPCTRASAGDCARRYTCDHSDTVTSFQKVTFFNDWKNETTAELLLQEQRTS